MILRSASRATALAVLLSAALGGCAEYLDRRDAITLHSGEAIAANRVVQMIDPWPATSANRNIASNGEKAATAAERYRTGKIIQPVNATTSSTAYEAAQQAQSTANNQASSSPNLGGGSNASGSVK